MAPKSSFTKFLKALDDPRTRIYLALIEHGRLTRQKIKALSGLSEDQLQHALAFMVRNGFVEKWRVIIVGKSQSLYLLAREYPAIEP